MKKIGPKWALTFERMRGDWPPTGTVSRRRMQDQLRGEGISLSWSQYQAAFRAAGLPEPEKRYGWKAYTPAHVAAVRDWWMRTRHPEGSTT